MSPTTINVLSYTGIAYVLRLLNQWQAFDSLHWFDTVRAKYMEEREKVVKQSREPGSDQKLQQSLALTLKRLDTYQKVNSLCNLWNRKCECLQANVSDNVSFRSSSCFILGCRRQEFFSDRIWMKVETRKRRKLREIQPFPTKQAWAPEHENWKKSRRNQWKFTYFIKYIFRISTLKRKKSCFIAMPRVGKLKPLSRSSYILYICLSNLSCYTTYTLARRFQSYIAVNWTEVSI